MCILQGEFMKSYGPWTWLFCKIFCFCNSSKILKKVLMKLGGKKDDNVMCILQGEYCPSIVEGVMALGIRFLAHLS
jgi:hypothetical protein